MGQQQHLARFEIITKKKRDEENEFRRGKTQKEKKKKKKNDAYETDKSISSLLYYVQFPTAAVLPAANLSGTKATQEQHPREHAREK